MAYVDWLLKGPKIASCNCDYGCPCEFNGRPSRGVVRRPRGAADRAGPLRRPAPRRPRRRRALSLARAGARRRRHRPGRSSTSARAQDQRAALLKILGGQEQEPTTVFNIYGSTIAKELDPVFAPIEFACDIAGAHRPPRGAGRDGDDDRADPQSGHRPAAPRASSACPKASSSARPRSRAAPSAARARSSAFATGTATPL